LAVTGNTGKPGIHNSYTAIIICGFDEKQVHVLYATYGHWTILQMRDRIKTLVRDWNVDLVLIEDMNSGTALVQLLKDAPGLNAKGQIPKGDKEARMSRHEGFIEAGKLLLPKEASLARGFRKRALGFPQFAL
jgi:predicted phage terminase large subunit-like protein